MATTEVPLVFPDLQASPRRYVVDEECNVRRLSAAAAAADHDYDGNDAHPAQQYGNAFMEDDASNMGSSCISTLVLRGKDVILTTSALVECPQILNLALSWTSDPMESPQLIQLDLRRIIASEKFSGDIVKIQGFSEDTSEGLAIRVVLVDNKGTFLVIKCTEQLLPSATTPARLLGFSDYVSSKMVNDAVASSVLHPNMVAFATASYACIALSPFIVSVDIDKGTSSIWSESECLESMRSSIAMIFTKTSEALMGKVGGSLLDMPPVAAMCLAVRPNPLLDPYFLFTVHSDASIRKWTIQPDFSTAPTEVYKLQIDQYTPPRPSEWSGSSNSVSLSSRLYGQVFALALHVQVHNAYFHVGNTASSSSSSSSCHLHVIDGAQIGDDKANCRTLLVPPQAASMVSMSFLPGSSRCALAALYRSNEGIIDAVYPPSLASMVSTEPVVGTQGGTLDATGAQESKRAKALSFMPDEIGLNLQDDLHQMDTSYMKYLFRPIHPRGTGTVLPPSRSCIRSAMAKLIRGYNFHQPYSETQSTELETLRSMEDWRVKEERSQFSGGSPMKALPSLPSLPSSPPPATPATPAAATGTFQDMIASPQQIYKSFVDCENDDEQQENEGVDESSMQYEPTDELDEDGLRKRNERKLQEHDRRWRQLLLQVLEEEEALRQPLSAGWIESSSHVQVLIRAGITTVLTRPSAASSLTNQWNTLDDAALSLLNAIEVDPSRSIRLYQLEQNISSLISTADLATQPSTELRAVLQQFKDLATWAWMDDEAEGITDEKHNELEAIAESISVQQLIDWVKSRPDPGATHLPGLMIYERDAINKRSETDIGRLVIANSQLRHAACTLATRCADSMRRLLLARWLLLSDLIEGEHATTVAQRSYFQCVATLWTSAQHVPMPDKVYRSSRPKTVDFDSSPLRSGKRLSFGDDAQSLLPQSNSKVTTCMDVVMMESSQKLDSSQFITVSPVEVVTLIAFAFVDKAFPTTLQHELGALPAPRDTDVVTDYPRLALRLLAPMIASPIAGEILANRRNETVAECLLIESHKQGLKDDQIVKLRDRASQLLISDALDTSSIDASSIQTAIDALKSVRHASATPTVRDWESNLKAMLKSLVRTDDHELNRVVRLESVKTWFLPLIGNTDKAKFDDPTRSAIKSLVVLMTHVAQLIHRITVVTRHIGSFKRKHHLHAEQGSLMVIQLIQNAIAHLQKTIPKDECDSMPEYINLWSALFQHSVNARSWEQAFSACTSNPDEGRRDGDLRQLVRDMVDSGALHELITVCNSIGSGAGGEDGVESHDLYGIACNVLTKLSAAAEEFYTLRATSPEPYQISDYSGALFVLHTAQHNWRSAAQTMEKRYVNAQRALQGGSYSNMGLGPSVLRDNIIVEDLALASVSSSCAFHLIQDSSTRYLRSSKSEASRQVGNATTQTANANKRGRVQPDERFNAEEESEDMVGKDVLMTGTELSGLVRSSLLLRTIFMDKSIDPLVGKHAFLSDKDVPFDVVKKAFDLGYFAQGLMLAHWVSTDFKLRTGSSGIGGEDIFSNAVRVLIRNHVVPIAFGVRDRAAGDRGIREGGTYSPMRPTLRQIQHATSFFDKNDNFSFARAELYKKLDAHTTDLLAKSAMMLLEKVVCFHSNADKTIAAHAANAILATSLDLHGVPSQLPLWLQAHLKGDSCNQGAFAATGKPSDGGFRGDPSALLSLYMKYGMFEDGCDLAASILSSATNSTKNQQTRLPERGGLTFVPTKKIDMLWNLTGIAMKKQPHKAQTLLEARGKLETALAKYCEMLKISEMGQTSARALLRNR